MAKKYMECENLELLSKYDLEKVYVRVSRRAKRLLTPESVEFVSEVDNFDEQLHYFRHGLNLKNKTSELYIEKNKENEELEQIYYLYLRLDLDGDKLVLSESKQEVLKIRNKEKIESISIVYYDLDTIKEFMLNNGANKDSQIIKGINTSKFLNSGNYLGNLSYLKQMINRIEYDKNYCLYDLDFLKKYPSLSSDIYSSGVERINTIYDFLDHLKLPDKFVNILKEYSYKYFVRHIDHRGYEEVKLDYPNKILSYLIFLASNRHLNYSEFLQFTRTFPCEHSFFKIEGIEEIFVKFIIKSQYIGFINSIDKMKDLYEFMNKNKIKITKDNFNLKSCYYIDNLEKMEDIQNLTEDDILKIEINGFYKSMDSLIDKIKSK